MKVAIFQQRKPANSLPTSEVSVQGWQFGSPGHKKYIQICRCSTSSRWLLGEQQMNAIYRARKSVTGEVGDGLVVYPEFEFHVM